ncbi:MAG: type 4a pilus biogenesis protein PilO, partial [Myxococcota bacterium]
MADAGIQSFGSLPTAVKAAVIVPVLSVLSMLYYVLLHVPLADDINAAKSQFNQLIAQEQEARRRQTEYLQVTRELANREAVDRANKRVLPADAEIASFLQDLNRLAELSGLRMRLVEPRPEEAQELYVRLPVTLGLSGRFHQLAKFFFNVSQLERAINMENVALREPSLEADEVRLRVDVLATTFRRPAEESAS